MVVFDTSTLISLAKINYLEIILNPSLFVILIRKCLFCLLNPSSYVILNGVKNLV